jgi:CheY-like chemotaxis protein
MHSVLCIDDEEIGLRVRKLVLESEGYKVLTALDGPTGIAMFRDHKTDAVIVDYSMPGMDGAEVAQALKREQPQVPVIMLSAGPQLPEDASPVVDAYVQKGQAPAMLLHTLEALLHIRGHVHGEFDGKYVAFVDEKRCYLDVTDGVCELLGYSRSELLGMRIDDLAPPESVYAVDPLFEQYLADKALSGEFVLMGRDGQRIPIRYYSRVFPDGCLVARWEPLEKHLA